MMSSCPEHTPMHEGMSMQVSRKPPPLTTEQLVAQHKENERQAKERAREACQQQFMEITSANFDSLRAVCLKNTHRGAPCSLFAIFF